ncbi:N-acetylmuramoyl-L-alanine amidase [Paenibacillus herberti]|uniref:N-acetylmuramoyl-L-alanine amidase n=2 Tax=Paenibacillus herberti TaxID=1619309 RepID=A0A229P5H0_9BACL|nr:N-acetylmuramoyl-L-alanine amidase [Paenibacillus herberti]
MRKTIFIFLIAIAALFFYKVLFKVEVTATEITTELISKEAAINVNNPSSSSTEKVLEGKKIVLDAGHGGRDVGATGQSGLEEKEITLHTIQNIKKLLLEKTGAEVILTRDEDESLSLAERAKISNDHNADLFISIHYDAFESSDVSGITTYYGDDKHQQLANLIHEKIFEQDMEVRDRGVTTGDYHVLRENESPSILLELGFISNKEDEQRMQSLEFQTNTANLIAEGIVEYLSQY